MDLFFPSPKDDSNPIKKTEAVIPSVLALGIVQVGKRNFFMFKILVTEGPFEALRSQFDVIEFGNHPDDLLHGHMGSIDHQIVIGTRSPFLPRIEFIESGTAAVFFMNEFAGLAAGHLVFLNAPSQTVFDVAVEEDADLRGMLF